MTAPLSKDLVGLAVILGTSGFIHLGKPEVYEPIMPEPDPGPPRGDLRVGAR